MTYPKTAWVNDTTPAINETNLNKIETGIEDAHTMLPPFWKSFNLTRDGQLGSIPTRVYRGIFRYFSFPIWVVQNEDIIGAMRVPFDWDGATNPHIYFITSPTGAEAVDARYQFQLEWASSDVGHVIPSSVAETLTCEVTLTSGTNAAFYAHLLDFELDASTIVTGQNLQCRLLRIAATQDEVANEPAVFHWDSRWRRNNLGTASISGY